MKKKYMLIPATLIMISMLAGCGNKTGDSLKDIANESSAETSTDSGNSTEGNSKDSSVANEPNATGDTGTDNNSKDTTAKDNTSSANGAENDVTAGNSTKDDSSSDENASSPETSPFTLWEYVGYVDECEGYTWQEEFFDCDYDGDGKTDRVNRSWDGDKQTATYQIEFGNGDKLLTPVAWETGFPHIQSGDLDGDGVKEILVTLTYDTSTDPYSFGDMWLFDKDKTSGEYTEVELPLINGENGAKGFNVDYDKPEDNKIRFTVREAGLSRTEEVDADYISNWWSDDLTTQVRPVFYAEIVNDSNPVLRCYFEPLHRWGPMMGFNLNYVSGKYEIGYIELDTPDSWE